MRDFFTYADVLNKPEDTMPISETLTLNMNTLVEEEQRITKDINHYFEIIGALRKKQSAVQRNIVRAMLPGLSSMDIEKKVHQLYKTDKD